MADITDVLRDIRNNPKFQGRVNVCNQDASDAFDALTLHEQKYAYWCSRASWSGLPIILNQVSAESYEIFNLLNMIFADGFQNVKNACKYQYDYENILEYAAHFYSGLGNYCPFAGRKFVPLIEIKVFRNIVGRICGMNGIKNFNKVSKAMFDLKVRTHGMNDLAAGTQNQYIGEGISNEALVKIAEIMKEHKIDPCNTNLMFDDDIYYINVASAANEEFKCDDTSYQLKNNYEINVQYKYGLHSVALTNVCKMLSEALPYTSSSNQEMMIKNLRKSFMRDDKNISHHKKASGNWVDDKDPSVEFVLGFIESYGDPQKVRGSFQGSVFIVDRNQEEKYGELVSRAEEFLADLPHNDENRIKEFIKPDYYAVDAITMACGGKYIGVNIPNYPEVRRKHGFKNISLANIMNARVSTDRVQFMAKSWQYKYSIHRSVALTIGVAVHEMLGHGSKYLMPEHYTSDETAGSKFGHIDSAYEECRAECTELALSNNEGIMDIFVSVEADSSLSAINYKEIREVRWMQMLYSGVCSIKYYSTEHSKWQQDHCWARYVILRVIMEGAPKFITVKTGDDVIDELEIDLDVVHLDTAQEALNNFLRKLHQNQSEGNVAAGTELFLKYSVPTEEHIKWIQLIKDNAKPRALWVQPNLIMSDSRSNLITYKSYPDTYEGIVDSFRDRVQMNYC